jgi:hypothetical protein
MLSHQISLDISLIIFPNNLLLLILFGFTISLAKAQMPPGQYTSTNKKAIKYLRKIIKKNNISDDENYELPKVFIQRFDSRGEISRSFGMCYEYTVTID